MEMKRWMACLMATVLCFALCTGVLAEETTYTVATTVMAEQTEIDEALLAEAEAGYTLTDPFWIVDPYGKAPLSAVVIFDTEEETTVSMTVKGHDAKNDITAEFPAAKRHILTVTGLYAASENTVEFTLGDGTTSTLIIETEAVDEKLLKAEIVSLDETVYTYDKLNFIFYVSGQKLLAYDSQGDLRVCVDVVPLPVRQLSDGHFLAANTELLGGTAGNGSTGLWDFDLSGRIYKEYLLPGCYHHDVVELPNGNLLAATSHDERDIINDRVVEIDRETGEIVWDLDMCQLLDPSDGSCAARSDANWFHNNSLDYDEATDSVILSSRHVDGVVSVSRADKTVNWILGNPEGWTKTDMSLFFTPTEGQEDFEWQYQQHNATMPDANHVLLFDNGASRYKTTMPEEERPTDVYSRAVLYAIDTENMTITQEWSYGKERGEEWFSSYISGANYDAEVDGYWLCSGGSMLIDGKYLHDMSAMRNGEAFDNQSIIDLVCGDKVAFEMKLAIDSFRTMHTNPYRYAIQLDLATPGVTYSYTAK